MARAKEHLSARDLLAQHGRRVHVNAPLHYGDTPLHDHDFWEIALVRSGRAIHRQLDGTAAVREGGIVILAPGQWHAWERCEALRLFNVSFTRDVLQGELAWSKDDPLLGRLWCSDTPQRWRLNGQRKAQLEQLISALQEDLKQANAHLVGRLLLVLAAVAEEAPQNLYRTRSDEMMQDVVKTLRAVPQHDWSLAELAQQFALERSYLGRRFRRAMGLSPMAWLARHRCELAALRLLFTSDSVAEIGFKVGWSDANYFSRRFNQEMGMSPSQYRRQLPVPAMAAASAEWIQW